MKKILSIAILAVFALVSCKTSKDVTPVIPAKSTNNIKAPVGFTWQNSRNINFTVSVTDTRFQTAIYRISIYAGDPATGASLLAKGSATTRASFKSKIYTSNQITQVYIVKTSPDNSKTTQKIQVVTANVVTSIGI